MQTVAGANWIAEVDVTVFIETEKKNPFPLKQEIERQKLPFLHFFGGKTKDLQSFRVTSWIFMSQERRRFEVYQKFGSIFLLPQSTSWKLYPLSGCIDGNDPKGWEHNIAIYC